MNDSWPHAPVHWGFEAGIYIVTAGIYHKQPLLDTPERRDLVLEQLFAYANEFHWHLQAWALMQNHYHIVARADDAANMASFIGKYHANTARALNLMDKAPGRRVWFQFWDTHITTEKSWLARLRYVHTNPVHHGVTEDADSYRWCSAAWFNRNANKSFVNTLERFKTDSVSVPDTF